MDYKRGAITVCRASLALGNEEFEADGAMFVRNRLTRKVHGANHVTAVTASTPKEVDRLMARVDMEFNGFPHRRFDVDFDTPPSFEARLVQEGYERNVELVMLLEGDLLATNTSDVDICTVTSDADWKALRALRALYWQESFQTDVLDADIQCQFNLLMRANASPDQWLLAYTADAPRAYCSVSDGVDGIVYIGILFTHPDFRHRGLANGLLRRGVTSLRSHGAGATVLTVDPYDTVRHMYARLGFRPVGIRRRYLKIVGT